MSDLVAILREAEIGVGFLVFLLAAWLIVANWEKLRSFGPEERRHRRETRELELQKLRYEVAMLRAALPADIAEVTPETEPPAEVDPILGLTRTSWPKLIGFSLSFWAPLQLLTVVAEYPTVTIDSWIPMILAAAAVPVLVIIVVLRPDDAFFRFFAGGSVGVTVVRGLGLGVVAIATFLVKELMFG